MAFPEVEKRCHMHELGCRIMGFECKFLDGIEDFCCVRS